jgi:hypothetical protein
VLKYVFFLLTMFSCLIDCALLVAAAYDWKCVHDESFLVYEIAQVFGNVRCSLLTRRALLIVGFAAPDFSRELKRKVL